MKKNSTSMPGQVRIIGGQWRGRKLPVPDSHGLRPTTDRVRETLFNWLSSWIVGARCLDCFAGSGALGFEALSRHASLATFLECERHIVKQLENNLALLQSQQGQIIHTDTLTFLKHPGEHYDIVFVDPPFHHDLLTTTLHLLESCGWLAAQALIYVECERKQQNLLVPPGWRLKKENTAGQVAYRLYYRDSTDVPGLC